MRWDLRRHERHARRVAAFPQMGNEGRPFLIEVEEVRLAHPPRHLRKPQLRVRRPFHRIHADPLLPRIPPLFLDIAGRNRRRSHQQDKKLNRIDRFRGLFPPINAAFHEQAIQRDGNVRGFATELFDQLSGKLFVLPRVR